MVRVAAIGAWIWLAAWSAQAAEPPTSDAARTAYASAAALQNREAWDLAAEEWTALIKSHPTDPLALKGRYYLAVCQLKAADWPAAEKTLRDVIASKADADTQALARLELGRGLFRAAQAKPAPAAFAAAATTLADFLATSPAHPQAAEAASLAAESLWQAGRRDEAIAAWQAFIRDRGTAPQVPDVLYALGVGLAEQGKRPEAAAVLERFAKEHPGHRLAEDVALWRADVALALDRPADAETIAGPIAAGGGPRATEALERVVAAGHRLAVLELDAKRPEAALATASKALAAAGTSAAIDAATLAALELDRADALWAIPARKKEAVSLFASIAERYPATPAAGSATSMAALALLEAGKPAEALARADAFLAKHAAQAAAAAVDDVRAIRAEALLALGKRNDAAAAYRELTRASQQSGKVPAWRLREATALAAAGSWQPAHELLAAVASKLTGDQQAEALLLDAMTLVELKDPGAAAAVLAALEKAHPAWNRRDEVLLLAARALKEKGDSKAALATAERLAKEFPAGGSADQVWYRLGQLRQEAGQHDKAIEAFTRSLTAKPDGSRASWALLATGWCHEAKGRLPEAIAAWTTLVQKHPTSTAAVSALVARADARQRSGDFAGGLADVERLLAEGGDLAKRLDAAAVAEARFIQGLCLVGQEKHVQAAATFRTLLADAPAFPSADRACFEMGLALAAAGKPDDTTAAGKPDEATAAFADLIKRFPQSSYVADAWLEIAERRWAADDWVAAAEAYRAAIAAAGKDPELASLVEQARHKLGWTHVMRREPGPAAEAFQAQLAAAPNGPLTADAAALLGDALVSLGRQAEAAPAFARALADPATLSSDTLRGLAFIRAAEAAAGREAWEESLALAEKFLAASPDAPRAAEARYAAAWARQNLGRLDEALAGYRGLADGPRTELAARARLMEGEVLFEQGQHKEAIKSFFKAAYGFGEQNAPPAFHPWQAQAIFEAARCFEVLGQEEQARTLYAELIERYSTSVHVPAARKRLEALGKRTAATGAKP